MTALAAALGAAGLTGTTDTKIPDAPKDGRRFGVRKGLSGGRKSRWGRSDRPNMIEWTHDEIGSIKIELIKFTLGSVIHHEGPNTWSRINFGNLEKPKHVKLDFSYDLKGDVELIWACGDKVMDTREGNPPQFVVPITWKPGRKTGDPDMPEVSHGNNEDFQLYAFNTKTGFCVHLDISAVSRHGEFWLTVQEVTGARLAWHNPDLTIEELTSVVVDDKAYTLVPVYSENCYPGFDPVASWQRSYPGRIEQILNYAVTWNAAVPVEECEIATWKPEWPAQVPDDLASKGYHKAVVLWYNLTIGQGRLQLESGEVCFVHFKAVQDQNGNFLAQQGEFPVLLPATGVYVKYMLKPDRDQEMKPAATVARVA